MAAAASTHPRVAGLGASALDGLLDGVTRGRNAKTKRNAVFPASHGRSPWPPRRKHSQKCGGGAANYGAKGHNAVIFCRFGKLLAN